MPALAKGPGEDFSNSCLNLSPRFLYNLSMKDTRQKILRTAARLFAQKGFSGASVRDIVSAARVNVSAVHYYFGDKRKLYKETLQFLAEEHRRKSWDTTKPLPTEQDIHHYSREEALKLLRHMLDYLLECEMNNRDLPLERIFTRVELESAPMRKVLLSYLAPYSKLPHLLLSKLTGLSVKSPELLVTFHSIFGQAMLSECHRLVILKELGVSHISPVLRQQIKNIVWRHTLAILNSYQGNIK